MLKHIKWRGRNGNQGNWKFQVPHKLQLQKVNFKLQKVICTIEVLIEIDGSMLAFPEDMLWCLEKTLLWWRQRLLPT